MIAITPTSGPWQVKHDWDNEGATTVIGNVDGEYIDGQAHTSYDFVCRTIDDEDDSQSISVAIANARAIAALPDLIAAAMAVSAIRPSNWQDDDDADQVAAWRKLDAALKSAGVQ